jgi:hypothetical protein
MVPSAYHAFFTDSAEVAGSLIGLLFVAVSLSPDKLGGSDAQFQVRAVMAFAVLTNGLIIALIALLPGDNLAVTGIVLSCAGVSTSVGLGAISFRHAVRPRRFRALLGVSAVMALFVVQLVNSIRLDASPQRSGPIGVEALLIVASFGFAIERAWDLVGVGRTGMLAMFRKLLTERQSPVESVDLPPDEAPTADSARNSSGQPSPDL